MALDNQVGLIFSINQYGTIFYVVNAIYIYIYICINVYILEGCDCRLLQGSFTALFRKGPV